MKHFLFFIILSVFCLNSAFAQDELDDFDFFEQTQEEEDDFFKKQEEPKDKKKPKKKKKNLDGGFTFYHIPGNLTMNIGALYLANEQINAEQLGDQLITNIIGPFNIDIQLSTIKNLTIGFRYIYNSYKLTAPQDSNRLTASVYPHKSTDINEQAYTGLISYHFSDLLGLDVDRIDYYASVFFGVNAVNTNWQEIGLPQDIFTDNIIGYGAGIRYVYSDAISFYTDFGYSRYGVVNFGLTYRLLNLQL